MYGYFFMDYMKLIVLSVLFFIFKTFILCPIFKWLWNNTITRIFLIRKIEFWEAFRILIIMGILMSSMSYTLKM